MMKRAPLSGKRALHVSLRGAVVLIVSLSMCLWMYSRTSSAAENRASLHLDSVHTLNYSGRGDMSGFVKHPLGPQDFSAFEEWLNPNNLNLTEIWWSPKDDLHPPLYMALVHVLRVSGFDFQTAFLAVNLLGLVSLAVGILITCWRDRRSLVQSCLALLFVGLTPAAFATSQEARGWMLCAGLSMVSMSLLSSATISVLRNEVIRRSRLVAIVVSAALTLMVETSFFLGFAAWVFASQLLTMPRRRSLRQWKISIKIAIPVVALWLASVPGSFRHFSYATSMKSESTSTWSLFAPHLNTEISAWFLRRMGDLWQIGGDRRITYFLLAASGTFLLLGQVRNSLPSRELRAGGELEKPLTHTFVVGLTGSFWLVIYFGLFSFEYLPTYAVGFKYILPFGVLLLFGIFDGVTRLRAGTAGALLLALIMAYHAEALDLPGQSQGEIVAEMVTADGIVVVGSEWDTANLMYAIHQVDEYPYPDVFRFSSPAVWREEACTVFPRGSRVAVFAKRPPWGEGIEGLVRSGQVSTEARVLGVLEFGEVAVVNACAS